MASCARLVSFARLACSSVILAAPKAREESSRTFFRRGATFSPGLRPASFAKCSDKVSRFSASATSPFASLGLDSKEARKCSRIRSPRAFKELSIVDTSSGTCAAYTLACCKCRITLLHASSSFSEDVSPDNKDSTILSSSFPRVSDMPFCFCKTMSEALVARKVSNFAAIFVMPCAASGPALSVFRSSKLSNSSVTTSARRWILASSAVSLFEEKKTWMSLSSSTCLSSSLTSPRMRHV
mmetsp:Transcript_35857/g.65120  ORF Transcript_35857/g.65120 Transcript_35857/m.65120 type:complete len:240 (-) Transcript_35857:168-887(-)